MKSRSFLDTLFFIIIITISFLINLVYFFRPHKTTCCRRFSRYEVSAATYPAEHHPFSACIIPSSWYILSLTHSLATEFLRNYPHISPLPPVGDISTGFCDTQSSPTLTLHSCPNGTSMLPRLTTSATLWTLQNGTRRQRDSATLRFLRSGIQRHPRTSI